MVVMLLKVSFRVLLNIGSLVLDMQWASVMFGDFHILYLLVGGELFWSRICCQSQYSECLCLWWRQLWDRLYGSLWQIFSKLWAKGCHFYHMGCYLVLSVFLSIMCYWSLGLCCILFIASLLRFHGAMLIQILGSFGTRLAKFIY